MLWGKQFLNTASLLGTGTVSYGKMMIELSQLKIKIKTWLDVEGYGVSEKDDTAADFHLVVSNFSPNAPISDIVKPKGKDVIVTGVGVQNPPMMLQSFESISEQERYRFFSGLQRELLKFKVDHQFSPNVLLPEKMVVSDVAQIDGLTGITFMNSFKSVKYAMLFLLWSVSSKFSPQSSQVDVSNTSNSRKPYG